MMKIEITPEAFNDLEGIREYLDEEFKYNAQGDRQ